MALNFGILQPVNIGGQFMAGRQQAQEQVQKNELAQQQLAASKQQMAGAELTQRHTQMQMDQLQRDRDALTKLQEQFVANGKSPDLETNADAMIASGIQHYVDLGSKIKQKVLEQKQFANIMGGGAPAAAPAIRPSVTPGAMGSGTFDPNAPAPVAPMNALAPAAAAPAAEPVNALAPAPAGPDVSTMRRKRDQLLAMGTTQSIAAAGALDRDIALASKEPVYHNVSGVGLVDPRTGKVVTPEGVKPSELVRNYEYAKTQGFAGSLFDYERKLKEAGRAPATPATPSAPVAVVDPVTGKQVYVSREQAISGKMSPAAAMESIPPKELQKREAALPQATSAIKGFESKADNFVNDLIKLRDHPGLEGITGAVYGRTGSLTAASSAAQALYDKVVAKGGFQALQDLRDASKTGGALGNISNQEGKQLTSSFAAIDRRQSAEDVKAAIDQAIADVQGSKTRMREAYDSTYSYKSGGAPSVAPAAANVVTHPQFPGFSVGK